MLFMLRSFSRSSPPFHNTNLQNMQSPSGLESPPYAAATTTITTPAIASSAASASSSSAAAAKPPSYYSSAKAITPADRYAVELVLTDELRHMAATELRETDAMREQSLHAMREWIEQNPRLQRVRFGELESIWIRAVRNVANQKSKKKDVFFVSEKLILKKVKHKMCCSLTSITWTSVVGGLLYEILKHIFWKDEKFGKKSFSANRAPYQCQTKHRLTEVVLDRKRMYKDVNSVVEFCNAFWLDLTFEFETSDTNSNESAIHLKITHSNCVKKYIMQL